MSTTVTLRPTSTIQLGTANTLVGAATAHQALSDDSDASYVEMNEAWWGASTQFLRLDFGSPTIPAGSKILWVGLRLRTSNTGVETDRIGATLNQPATSSPGAPQWVDVFVELPEASPIATRATIGAWLADATFTPWTASAVNACQPWFIVDESGTGTVRLYEVFLDVVYGAPPNAPFSDFTPADGSTVTTDIPTFAANRSAYSEFAWGGNLVQIPQYLEWQIASDAGFTTNLKSLIEPSTDAIFAGVSSEVLPAASQLFQTTWYYRVRGVTRLYGEGAVSPWSTTQDFLVSHPPNAPTSLSPSSNAYRDWGVSGAVSFSWTFSDPSPVDTQTAYQIIVERNDTGAAVADTGKVSSAYPTGSVTITAAQKDQPLRWKVRVWDSDDVVGVYSALALFKTGDLPSVVITSPANAGTASTPQPTVLWTFSAGGGRTQAQRRVIFRQGSTIIFDSGWSNTSATSFTPPQALLLNSTAYTVEVQVQDSAGLQNTDTNSFTTAWTPPAVPTGAAVTISLYDSSGFVRVTWDDTVRDSDFYGWQVLRRITGETAYESIFITTVATVDTYDDWFANSGISYEYAVLQLANRFGTIVPSTTTWLTAVVPSSTAYWLIHPLDFNQSFKLEHVTSDDFEEQYESSTLDLIGRGRKRDYGTRFGYTGTLVADIRNTSTLTARQQKQALEAMKAEKRDLYLRNPFGDTWLVAIDNLSVSRIAGVGSQEMCTITIPYAEVS